MGAECALKFCYNKKFKLLYQNIQNVDYVVLQDFNKISALINTYLQLQVVHT